MSELSATSSSKAHFFFIHLLSDFYLFFSFILSHPLYFSYFIFFSPYFLKLISFLSPLFFTTSLLILTFLVNFISHDQNPIWDWEFSSKKNMGFLTIGFYAILDKFRSKVSDNYHITDDSEDFCFEDSEVFKIVFDIPPVNVIATATATADDEELFYQALDSEFSSAASTNDNFTLLEEEIKDGEYGSGPICRSPEKQPIRNGSEAESNKIENDKTTKSVSTGKCDAEESESSDEKKLFQDNILQYSNNNNPQKVLQLNNILVPSSITKECSCSCCCSNSDGIKKLVESSRTLDYNLGTYGSMRKEKEWKRTLACKLFEERHNVVKEGGEGMDLLWETYESESSKTKSRTNIHESKNKNKNKSSSYQEIKEDTDKEEEDDESNGQLCCLQAFKFSAGKMNLGMGKPNLVKITKAIKGFGWLHKVSSRRSKKVHNGD